MNRRSKSTLFLMEQLIVVAVFAICAAACVRILTESYFMATDSRNLGNAIQAAESGAECYKAVGGDVAKVAEILGGTSAGTAGAGTAFIYYDENWMVCRDAVAEYRMRVVSSTANVGAVKLFPGELSVEKLSGEVIMAFTITAIDNE